MRLDDTLIRWYGSPQVAEAVLSGLLGDVERSVRSIVSAPNWRSRYAPELPAGIVPDPAAAPAPAAPARNYRFGVFESTTAALMELAASPEGVTTPEACAASGRSMSNVAARFANLVLAGHLTKVKAPGELVRHFAKRDDAEAWAAPRNGWVSKVPSARVPAPKPPPPPGPRLTDIGAPVARFEKPKGARPDLLPGSDRTRLPPQRGIDWKASTPAPVKVESRPVVEVITPEGVKVTRVESLGFDPRYQVDPKAKHAGAGFAAAGIGRSVVDGEPWK